MVAQFGLLTLLYGQTDNEDTVNSVTSCITSLAALVLMLSTLAYAPFSHVHSEEEHHGGGNAHGLQVHSHFSHDDQGAGSGTEESDDPFIDVSAHEGSRVGLFLSLAGKPFPEAESAQSHAAVMPQFQTSERQGAGRPDRARDPPRTNLSSRAPPV